jgi:hypothetical protein
MAGEETKGPLQSDLLRGNDRLQQCAQLDRFHVQPEEPPSEHVRLIQDALQQTNAADLKGEKNYGSNTTEAVINFKTKHRIFTRGTTSIDPIVGINTIRKLDELMKGIEDRRKPKPAPRKDPLKLVLSGQCKVCGEFQDNPQADDMKFGNPLDARKSLTTTAITAPFVLMDDSSLETTMQGSMFTAVSIASGANTTLIAEASAMVSRFFTNGGAQKDFAKGSAVSNAALADVGFIGFVSKVRFEVDRAVRAAAKTGVIDDAAIASALRTKLDSPSFGTGQFSGGLAAFIGGFQGYHVELCDLKVDSFVENFTYGLDITVFDHFGVDDSDINRQSGAIGGAIGTAMAAFFVLQHDRNEGGLNRRANKYRPFRVTLQTDTGPFSAKFF